MTSPLPAMEHAARQAGDLLRRHLARHDSLQVEAKGTNDFVTVADREAEEVVAASLEQAWPGIPFLAEESRHRKTRARRRWIIDPLDGTTNFIHGYPFFAVSIGLQEDETITAGVVYDPSRDEMFSARQGCGAFLNGLPIGVSGREDLADSMLVTGFPFREIDHLDEFLRGFSTLLRRTSGVRRDGSAALDLCWVAAGRSDGFWEKGLSPWDVAAGACIVHEAGGRVSDFQGEQNWLEGQSIVATTPAIHEAVRRAVAPQA